MTDVNLAGLTALSECVGVDFNSLAFVAVEKVGSKGESYLAIDCLYRAIALDLKSRMLEDTELSIKFLKLIREHWGAKGLFLKALGKSVWLPSLEGEERVKDFKKHFNVNQSKVQKFSERIGFDFGDSQIFPMHCNDGCTRLIINCFQKDVAILLRERLVEDFRYRRQFAEAIYEIWGLSLSRIDSKGEPYHFVSLAGAKRGESLVAPLYRMLDADVGDRPLT